MAGRVGEHGELPVVARLHRVLDGAVGDGQRLGLCDRLDGEVHVRLLGCAAGRPLGCPVVVDLLACDVEAGCRAFGRDDVHPVFAGRPDLPAEQSSVEVCERSGVGTVECEYNLLSLQ